MRRPSATWIMAAFLALAALYGLPRLAAQTGTTTYSSPFQSNLTQWGSNTVTAAGAMTDAIGNPTAPSFAAHPLAWTTTVWQRQIAPAIATFPTAVTTTARNVTGATVSEKSSRWGVFHNPAVSNQATISIAAEAAVRHVADCVSFSAASTTAPALTALTVNLRDGATGAGTVLQTWQLAISNTTGQNVAPFGLCGLNLPGTTNTAMTLEFSALLTNLIQSVSMTGYNVN